MNFWINEFQVGDDMCWYEMLMFVYNDLFGLAMIR